MTAIAYSTTDNQHGFFWGADKRDEAENAALKYCDNADGKNCKVDTVFRNHRHWKDDDGTGFPHVRCAALWDRLKGRLRTTVHEGDSRAAI